MLNDRGVLGEVLSQAETGVRHVTTESAVLGGEEGKRSMSQPRDTLSARAEWLKVWQHREDLCGSGV
jgi:hypothetical protein